MTVKMGIDLGGTKTEVVVMDADNVQLYRHRVATATRSYNAVLDMIAALVSETADQVGASMTIGIGSPGAISPRSGLLRNSNTACLNGRALKADLERLIGQEVRIENDANCFALSESIHGAAREYNSVFGVIVGTGTGGGLVINGSLVNGPHAITGEWGHNPMPWWRTEDGERDCYCGKKSCIETYLSGPGLAQSLKLRNGVARSSEDIIAAADRGDEVCQQVVESYHDQFARALAHLINILDPQAIVLGGGMSNIESIYTALPRLLPLYLFSDYAATPVLKARHGDSSGVLGAALLWG